MFKPIKFIALTLSSGFLISSIPTKAENLKTNYEIYNSNTPNNILIAQTSILPIIKKAIVRKNGFLKLKLAKPMNNIQGYVVVNSPTGSTKYLIKNAVISKNNKSITWKGGPKQIFANKNVLAIDTSNLKSLLLDGASAAAKTQTLGFAQSSLTAPSAGAAAGTGSAAGAAAVGAGVGVAAAAVPVVAPVVVAGVGAAAVLGGIVATGLVVGAASSGSGGNSSN